MGFKPITFISNVKVPPTRLTLLNYIVLILPLFDRDYVEREDDCQGRYLVQDLGPILGYRVGGPLAC